MMTQPTHFMLQYLCRPLAIALLAILSGCGRSPSQDKAQPSTEPPPIPPNSAPAPAPAPATAPVPAPASSAAVSPPQLPLAQTRLDFIPSDLSGVTWNAQTRTCFHVTNKSSGDAQCFETTREGRLLRAIAQQGFEDTEALVWLGGTRFAIAEERLQRITLCDITPETRILSREAPGHVSWTPLTDTPGNSGIEGMAFDPDRQCLYFCQEHPSGKDRIGPWYLYALHLQTGACTPLIDLRPRFTPSPQDPGVKDISELCFDPVTRSLLVLSHESDCVIRLAAPEKSSALESPHDWPIIDHVRGLGFKQAEGLCLAPTSVEPGSPLSVIISGEPAFWAQTPVWWK